jgi:hypothetical protein
MAAVINQIALIDSSLWSAINENAKAPRSDTSAQMILFPIFFI